MQQGGTGVFFVDLDTTISECIQKQWQTNATRTPPNLLSSLFTHTPFSLRAPQAEEQLVYVKRSMSRCVAVRRRSSGSKESRNVCAHKRVGIKFDTRQRIEFLKVQTQLLNAEIIFDLENYPDPACKRDCFVADFYSLEDDRKLDGSRS